MSKHNEEQSINPTPAWEIAGLPEEAGLFAYEVGRAAANIIKHDQLIRGAEEASGAEFPLVNADKMAEVGARLAIASLVVSGLLDQDAVSKLRESHPEDGITYCSVSKALLQTIVDLEEKTIYATPASEEGEL